MPSSLIIVALAAAWLAVLVPMIARKRQEITQTNDSALAARVVRSGSTRSDWRKEFAMTANAEPDEDIRSDDVDAPRHDYEADADDADFDEYDSYEPEPEPEPRLSATEQPPVRRYRPGRGGFDPEAAELAARAKYAFRQRVVLMLLLTAIVTGVLAGVLLSVLWWAHGAADAVLVGYLVYLRRQVRIEEEIRQRRLARLHSTAQRTPRRPNPLADIEVLKSQAPEPPGAERNPVPTSRVRRQAVVVDLEDEDPAFHELDDPGQLPYRRAAGE
ncbi:hypothetical protein FHU38_000814 [Saccharomonospora amisosensis]|uniref:Transmembrane protein n=1 Tax=Saccharomonospora amisosensis TaxID=1128677 RepID=A0A7X5UM06_9PSEU|nr:gephyrin-like molybdotransferase receptor GlpR [Saccharomonospora amisosensis]NIJ10470.1 hypothetical protein [Saccharomonospora amisosensis]